MKQYISLIIFIGVLGFITSLAFVGMDLLFSARIEANENAALYQAILLHNDETFTESTYFSVFESVIVVEDYVVNGQDVKLYINTDTNHISFIFGIFDASGYIDDIVGVLTIEDDFKTIVDITILQQGETPGLGGKVVLREFLDQFVGLELDDTTEFPVVIGPIGSTENAPNEVDQIAGATNTSNAFQGVLAESYYIYKDLWESRGQ
ncbi:MAG: FMN-binding protein [Acholeplasmataceae bacterium]|nr:FMN-binding protein [Acholeplasmataceae bacterium]